MLRGKQIYGVECTLGLDRVSQTFQPKLDPTVHEMFDYRRPLLIIQSSNRKGMGRTVGGIGRDSIQSGPGLKELLGLEWGPG